MKKYLQWLSLLVLFIGLSRADAAERWLFLGDSITQAGHYVDYVETWMLMNEEDPPEIIDLGLSSETISGLSEQDHPGRRPYVHNRLNRVLDRVKPDVVIACYGMNCGIYHPFSEERFTAYQDGIRKLVKKVEAIGADMILITPPPYAGRVKPKAPPAEGEPYGYRTPSPDYNEVLQRYADWILSLDGKDGIRSLTVRPGIERFMKACYPKEPVHPNPYGHKLMGEAFLQGIGKDTGSDLLETGIDARPKDSEWNTLLSLVQQQREIHDRALLNDIGHGNSGVRRRFTTPLSEAQETVKAINAELEKQLSKKIPFGDYSHAYQQQREAVLSLAQLKDAPSYQPAEGFAKEGNLQAIYFDALEWNGKATKVFAWLGMPDSTEGKVPGVVLVHGGGGTAFKDWVKKWNDHGFAAISIAVEGQTDEAVAKEKRRDNPRGWKRHQWAGPSRTGIYGDSDQPLEDQWMYHAVADTILANSFLRSLPQVDADKVGLSGISWGGIITSTVMGIDNRFAFAVPVYGCGHLAVAGNQYERALGENDLYREVWDPMVRMHRADMPALWLSWPGDKHFPLDSQAASYNAMTGPAMVSLIPGMRHGHPAGWNPPDSYAFAKGVVETGEPWCVQVSADATEAIVEVVFDSLQELDTAYLVSSNESGPTGEREWMETKASLSESNGLWKITAKLPEDTTGWFVNVKSGDLTASSKYLEQNPPIKDSSFVKSLVPGKFILPAEEGWWTWCMAPMYDEEGKLHMFNSAIPNKGRWHKDSEIRHYIADSVEGPYRYIDTPFKSDTHTYHNPQISKVGDTYVLVYLWKSNTTGNLAQEIGIATAKSLYGPWKESPHNPILRASGKMDGANILHASNPTFLVDEEGKYRIYYKSMTDKYLPETHREISLAISDNIEGPYKNYPDNPLISYADKGLDIEDPYAFRYKGMYYMIVEDRRAVKNMLEGNPLPESEIKNGGNRPGLIYKSKDGINWGRPEVGYQTNTFYFGHELARTERPHILWKDGEPEYLFLACHDDDPTAGFYLKIDEWK